MFPIFRDIPLNVSLWLAELGEAKRTDFKAYFFLKKHTL